VITFQFGLHGLAKDQELLTVDEYGLAFACDLSVGIKSLGVISSCPHLGHPRCAHGQANGRCFVPTLFRYSTLLGQITKAIQQHGQSHSAKVLFATTTPVPTNLTDPTSSLVNPPRFDRDVQAFNAAAKRVMQEHSVPVLDLYNFVHSHCVKPGCDHCPRQPGFDSPLHLTCSRSDSGSDACV
jgi:hypothetical protein